MLSVFSIYFIKEKFNLRIVTALFFIISFLILIASVILTGDTKTRVGQEREWAKESSLSSLSPFFSNKYIQSYRTSESLFFQNLDFGNYFFAGHPRERAGVEIQKLFAAVLFLIIFGIIKIKPDLRLFLASVFIFAVSIPVFLRDSNPSGHFLALPVLAFLAGNGIMFLAKDFGTKGKVILAILLLIMFLEAGTLYAAK